ncbi:dioxygenase family protein [Streptomyces sp. NPDC002867]
MTAALVATSAAGAALAAPVSPVQEARTAGRPLAVTPACDGHETPASTEGPLFKPQSPGRTDFITPAVSGVRLDLSGIVDDTACKPLPGSLIEFWQCDQNGDYDTAGFSLRGHQYTNSRGRSGCARSSRTARPGRSSRRCRTAVSRRRWPYGRPVTSGRSARQWPTGTAPPGPRAISTVTPRAG